MLFCKKYIDFCKNMCKIIAECDNMKTNRQTKTNKYFNYAQKFLLDIGAIYPSPFNFDKDIYYNNQLDRERIFALAKLNHKAYLADDSDKFLSEIENILNNTEEDNIFEYSK